MGKKYYYILGTAGIFIVLLSLPFIFGTRAAPESITIDIYRGWNIISSPFEESLSLSKIAQQCDLTTYKGKIWAWAYDPISGWTQPTQAKKDEGVYILSEENCTVKLTGTPAIFSSRSLKKGWNLISADKSFEEIKGDCQVPSKYKIWKYKIWEYKIWELNSQTQQWFNPSKMDKLDQRKGYWIAVERECALENIPLITPKDILEKFGIEVVGEVWDQLNTKGEKIGDYQLTPDELLLIYNVLSSLPQKPIEKLRDITVVYLDTPGSGGLLWSEERVVIFGTPDKEGASYTNRNGFISTLCHEIGHHVYYSYLSFQEREELLQLYNQSRNEQDFASLSLYGMNNPGDDFATLFKEYCMNTEALLERAGRSSLLQAKVEFVNELFSDYQYKVQRNGTIIRFEGEEKMIWPYKSRTNPEIEEKLFSP